MKYWEDFRSVHGFEGGNTAPQGIELVAEFYCQAINKLAKKYESEQKAVYWRNEETINNPHRIRIEFLDGRPNELNIWNAGMREALDRLLNDDDANPDEHIREYVDVLESADAFLNDLE